MANPIKINDSDLLLDQRVTYLYDQLKKAQKAAAVVTSSSATPTAPVAGPFLRWRGSINASQTFTVNVPGKAMPWGFAGGINAGLTFGDNDGIGSIVSYSDLIAGSPITITYLSGTVTVIFSSVGPAGVGATGTDGGSSGNGFATKYMPNVALTGVNTPTGALGLGGLCGAFVDDNGVVIKPLAVGFGLTDIVPVGATRLFLGINDDVYVDNTGQFVVSISGLTGDGIKPSYEVNDVVRFERNAYVCVVKNPNGLLPPNTNYWAAMTLDIVPYPLPNDGTLFLNGTGEFAAVRDSDLALTDITTNDVSTSKHGFAPKAPNDATKFLDGTGAYDTVKDSDLSLSDITTNNVSISKHGFVPKAPNDASKFLNGLGAFAVPALIPTVHDESLTDGTSNFIFAGGDIVTVVGVPN